MVILPHAKYQYEEKNTYEQIEKKKHRAILKWCAVDKPIDRFHQFVLFVILKFTVDFSSICLSLSIVVLCAQQYPNKTKIFRTKSQRLMNFMISLSLFTGKFNSNFISMHTKIYHIFTCLFFVCVYVCACMVSVVQKPKYDLLPKVIFGLYFIPFNVPFLVLFYFK